MRFVERTLNRVMVLKGGSPAIHKLGNIGRKDDEYIRVYAENETEYIGVFEEGFGFVDVRFKKADCRPLTQDEVSELNKKVYAVNGQIFGRVNLDNEGNFIKNESFDW